MLSGNMSNAIPIAHPKLSPSKEKNSIKPSKSVTNVTSPKFSTPNDEDVEEMPEISASPVAKLDLRTEQFEEMSEHLASKKLGDLKRKAVTEGKMEEAKEMARGLQQELGQFKVTTGKREPFPWTSRDKVSQKYFDMFNLEQENKNRGWWKPEEVRVPLESTPDGLCAFNSVCLALVGTEAHARNFRLRAATNLLLDYEGHVLAAKDEGWDAQRYESKLNI